MSVEGGIAYVADWDYGLRVVDVSNPAQPTEFGYCATSYALGVCVSGVTALVADGWALRVVDVSDPANPTSVGECETEGGVVDASDPGQAG